MTQTCECCEGIEKITPLTVVNRPGLDALAYRVGTHAAFLETMKARLSGFWLEVPREELGPDGRPRVDRIYPLRGLTTRESDDPAIALLDAWAMVGDVLTFYQERIANEGYLRTATERRSVLELVRLIAYGLRPGVAASVFFALTLEKDHSVKLKRNELRAQSVPGPGELPQTFENSEELEARAEWNTLSPRMTRPQRQTTIRNVVNNVSRPRVYLKGISTNLKANDPLLVDFGSNRPELFRVIEVEQDAAADRTLVKLRPWIESAGAASRITTLREKIAGLTAAAAPHSASAAVQQALAALEELQKQIDEGATEAELAKRIKEEVLPTLSETAAALSPRATVIGPLLNNVITELGAAAETLATNAPATTATTEAAATTDGSGSSRGEGDELIGALTGLVKPASIPPRNSLNLARDVNTSFALKADTGLQLIGAFQPFLRGRIQTALTNVAVTGKNPIRVYALRVKAAPFGHNAPLRSEIVDRRVPPPPGEQGIKKVVIYQEWILNDPFNEGGTPSKSPHQLKVLYLDAEYKIQPNSWVAILKKGGTQIITQLGDAGVRNESLAAYGVSGNSTRLDLTAEWISNPSEVAFSVIRSTVVLAQSEELPLAEEPIDDEICGGAGNEDEIELDRLYSDLKSGRWLIVSGERTDIKDAPGAAGAIVTGVRASELVMLAAVSHRFDPDLPGDKTHTFIKLAQKLEYCYKRDTITIYANVVKANHGETRTEVLGGGDATKPFQSFTLRQPPLTYVASPTPAGAESTLKVFVNDVQWHKTDTLAELSPADRKFITRTDDEGKTTVVFGNGERGARLPTGAENIRAIYRNGIGQAGNVRAEQISLLVTRPLGVKEVINPLRASGGADKEGRDLARKNAPLTVTALDRLVSTEDYADFARTFAGIGKSVAARFSDGRRELVHVTIAGADDIPIDESSDLFRNLTQALRQFGDPFQPFKVEVRELKFLVISARVRILPDYLWDPVVTNVRAKLLDTFSFERRELAEDVLLSEAISAMQSVKGVAHVDVDLLRGIPEKTADERNPGQRRLLTPTEIVAKINEPLRDALGKVIKEPLSRVTVNLAGFEAGVIRPAQLAYLTPDVPETLILNQI